MDWWVVKQLRALVLMDLREFVPDKYFDNNISKFKLNDKLSGSEYFSRELAWGYSAGELGRELFFKSTAFMTPRQVAACEVLMNLGMLAGAEAAHGVVKALHAKVKNGELSDSSVEVVSNQLGNQHIPAGIDNVKNSLRQYLHYLTPEEKAPFQPLLNEQVNDLIAPQETGVLIRILENINVGVRVLAERKHGRPSFTVENEYDIQDLLFVVVRAVFEDARMEEWTPKHAGKSKRIDMVIPSIFTSIEVKYIRSREHARTVSDEIKVDIESYHAHAACRKLMVFVYDPKCLVLDRAVFEKDLSGRRVKGSSEFDVRVMVRG